MKLVVNNPLADHDLAALKSLMSNFPQEELSLTISKRQIDRTVRQNSRYWKILSIISNETGHTTEELHEFFKARLLPRQFVQVGEYEAEVSKSTTKLSTEEMTAYVDQIIAFAAELSISIPSEPQ